MGHRGAESGGVIVAARDFPVFAQRPHGPGENFRIGRAARRSLQTGFTPGIGFEKFFPADGKSFPRQPWLQGFAQARFPVDEGAVAVESQGVEIGQFHGLD